MIHFGIFILIRHLKYIKDVVIDLYLIHIDHKATIFKVKNSHLIITLQT